MAKYAELKSEVIIQESVKLENCGAYTTVSAEWEKGSEPVFVTIKEGGSTWGIPLNLLLAAAKVAERWKLPKENNA